jgi:hypothetical protein
MKATFTKATAQTMPFGRLHPIAALGFELSEAATLSTILVLKQLGLERRGLLAMGDRMYLNDLYD